MADIRKLVTRAENEAATLMRFALADEYSSAENAIFESAAQALREAASTLLAVEKERDLAREWQPIETALRGTEIILGRARDEYEFEGVRCGYYRSHDHAGWCDMNGAPLGFTPTHWRPLPEPPVSLLTGEGGKGLGASSQYPTASEPRQTANDQEKEGW